MNRLAAAIGRGIARYLERPSPRYDSFSASDAQTLRSLMQPGDVLLVEGNRRISVAIKYLTQSTWSHAALYVGVEAGLSDDDGAPQEIVEADLVNGVVAASLSRYAYFNTRICRPVGLSDADRQALVDFVIGRLGHRYDLKNVFDLARYLFPTPPVPVRWRRRMLALGSGDPTRAICSTLIAQAFQSIRYPILPHTRTVHAYCDGSYTAQEIMHIRHHSLFAPRDFDISPYFAVLKPTLEKGFDYKKLTWEEPPSSDR